MTGNLEIHLELECALAEYLNQESALVFGSGFLTNIGVLTALAGRHDVIFSDRLNHASLVDGARLSRAKVVRYNHNDLDDLERLIKLESCNNRKIIITESVFSMDGDICPLEELCSLAIYHDAMLIVDEAHAIGIFESGILNQVRNKPKDLIVVGTLSKSFASYGGFAACSKSLRDLFINRSRSFIYSTGLAPASCASALAAIKIIKAEPQLGAQVLQKAQHLHELLNGINAELLPLQSQIIPIIVETNERAIRISKQLKAQGILCNAIRPPTVPENTSRLRLSLTAAHSETDLKTLAAHVKSLAAI
jgi:8-amino-7-oxononanoate synthase